MVNRIRRQVLTLGLMIGFSAASWGQQAVVRIVHGSNAGAPQDVMLRVLANEISKTSGRTVIVEAKPGASGQIAMSALKQAPADGNTLLAEGTGITSILQLPGHLHEWTDFEPLYRVQLDPFALYALPPRFKDFAAFAEEMRVKKDHVRIGGYAIGGPFQLVMMQLSQKVKGDFSWIPYDSGGKAITAVAGDQIEAAVSNVSVAATFTPRTKILAQTGEARLAQLPDVPTLKEMGIDLVKYHWRGFFIKKGTPQDIIERNYAMVKAGVSSARFQQYLRETGTIEGTMSRPAMAEMLAEQARNDTQLLKQLKMVN
ncbi:MAG: tripartite tricarboxylate transporter substrate binding protein [Pseudomonadota bacterium]